MRQGALGGSLFWYPGVFSCRSLWADREGLPFFWFLTLPCRPGFTLRWARFLSDKKSGKESPKEGPSPSLWNPPRGTGCPCVPLSSALGPAGSHRWHGNSMNRACSSAGVCFYRQGLTLVCSCSQLPVVWLYHASGLLQAQRPPCVKGAVSRKADGGIDLLQCLRRNPAPPPGTLRWGDFCSGKSHQNPLRAFPPKDPPWGTRLELRQVDPRPVTLAVVPGTATTPGHPGQLALRLGGFPVRAYPGEAAVPSCR